MNHQDLKQTLNRLQNQSYKAYKQIKGTYAFPHFDLIIDHVQGDPFATPSKLRIRCALTSTDIPKEALNSHERCVALRDFMTRRFCRFAHRSSRPIGTGHGGIISMDRPGQQILERSSCVLDEDFLEFRFTLGLPAAGRRILGYGASQLMTNTLPDVLEQVIRMSPEQVTELLDHVTTCEDAEFMRSQCGQLDLIAFVANDAHLPRETGFSDKPLLEKVVPFQSPPSIEVTLQRKNRPPIKGMGLRCGITLITGGGFHGKSTLLQALEKGIYNHIPDDGREWVVTDPRALKIRAEDGRSIQGVDISGFIDNLPLGKSTATFCTTNASGSTSQAANMMEGLELGCSGFLIDEDTSATNFLVRDRRMQELIAKDREPITPLLDRIRELHQNLGVSCILVMGGCGDYFDVADCVIAMNHYKVEEVTQRALNISKRIPTGRLHEPSTTFQMPRERTPEWDTLNPSRGKKDQSIKVRDVQGLEFGRSKIDLSRWEQLVDTSQVRAMGLAIAYLFQTCGGKPINLAQACEKIFKNISENGFQGIHRFPDGDLAQFRPLDLAATINRSPGLKLMNSKQNQE